ncbi:MAG TPA: patatin-like phospholipase family protein [Terricaulis sp.]|nr:patatin-like phospholipase family protein [Terricaulis sp.]
MRRFAALVAIVCVSACASGARSDFGLSLREHAVPVGFPDVRFALEDARAAEVLQEGLAGGVPHGPDGHFDLIALSGGGANGAFSAGIITAWTERGDRPDFEVVTGVSTGALAAPFVFLGPAYDDRLREAYTGGYAANLLQGRGFGALFGSGVFHAEPLRALIERFVDAPLLEAIAEEHRRGRILLVATTNLDQERGMLWNMGEIAAHGGPEALQLFRDVLQASASIPGAFPPVMLQAQVRNEAGELTGEPFDEMHVDGGVLNPFVALPQMLWTWRDRGQVLEGGRIWVVVNGKAAPVAVLLRDAAPDVLGRALDASLKANLRANITANRLFAARNGMSFEVAAIPPDFPGGDSLDFTPAAMLATYELGLRLMREGNAWSRGWEDPAQTPEDLAARAEEAREGERRR